VNTSSERETFTELYEEYMPKVFRYIQARVNNIPLAEDLTSATFEKALVNFEKYSKDRASFSTWIFSIARNTFVDFYRVESRRQVTSLEEATEVVSKDLSSEEEVEKKEELQRLKRCLSQLPEEEQEIVHLKFQGELNNRQIAKMLSLTESNVGTKLYRAVRKLRESFEEL
jgi:RNA polymerase sigma-70 factor (ECF subfamily)